MANLFNLLALTKDSDYSCGGGTFTFQGILPNIVSSVIMIIQIGVPIILIVMGMVDLGKAVMAQKDDEIKKGQQTFIKRLLAAVIVFFIVAVVKLVLSVIGESNSLGCINCFINADPASNDCEPANPNN
ncbi:MAG: hypothetical protein PHN72_01100 [Bacilli bacterium]|nr:hypothetical protein [Bacilli bacterium]